MKIDIRPLVIAREECDDEVEKEVLRALADDAALDLPFPSRLYETGGAKKLLNDRAFQALEVVMGNVYKQRAIKAVSENGRVIVCGLAAITLGECSRSARKGKSHDTEQGSKRNANSEGRRRRKKAKQGTTSRERPMLQRFCKMEYKVSKRQVLAEKEQSSSSSSEELVKVKVEVKEDEPSEDSSSDLVVLGEWRPGDSSDSFDEKMVIELSSDTNSDI